jgi:hypothetical protein
MLPIKWAGDVSEFYISTNVGDLSWQENVIVEGSPFEAKITIPGTRVFVKFVPPVSKTYIFTSNNAEGALDPDAELYNSSFTRLAANADNDDDGNFRISYSLTAN